jgi:hypothetical protein
MKDEKNSANQGSNSRLEELEKNKNTSLQNPGAPVNDYGRASEGLMEQQVNENKSKRGFEGEKEK